MSTHRSTAAGLVGLALVACGGGGGQGGADVEACEHLESGPSAAVTASPTADGAPAVDDDHMRYDIALPSDESGMNTGVVAFAPAEAAHYVFFLDQDVSVSIQDSSGGEVPIVESASSSPACELVAGRHVAELEVATYSVHLGPTAESEISMVVEPEGHDHDHEHDHEVR